MQVTRISNLSISSLKPGLPARLLEMLCFLVIYLFSASVCCSSVVSAETLTVTIKGIGDPLYENVLASLEIVEHAGKSDLTADKISKLHKKAEIEIAEALQPFGYYAPEIKKELNHSDGKWTAVYDIAPGDPVVIQEVVIQQGEGASSDLFQKMTEGFPLKKGDQLDHVLYAEGKKDLLQKFFVNGFVKASYAESKIEVNLREKSCRILLRVNPGELFLFGDIIYDQDLLEEDLLVRFVNFTKGESYSIGKILKLQQILYNTGYFSRVVVRGDIDGAVGVYIPVLIQLSPPDFRNRYVFGVGYATDDGFRGKIGWENKLINRSGHNISVEATAAQRDGSLEFTYGIPINDPRYDKFLTGATYSEDSWEETDSRLLKAGIAYDHRGSRFKYSAGVEIRDEKYEIGRTNGESFLSVPYVNWSAVYGDSYVDTNHGVFFSLTLRGAAEGLAADTTFLQAVTSGKVITTPLQGVRLIGRFSLGATEMDSFEDLPPSLRFYAGGDHSVRGYAYKELGSKDNSGTVVGGRYLVFGSIEAEKSLYENWSGAIFLDTGKGINDLTEDLAKGVGVGLRYRLPFGQIRVDVASALSEEDNPLRVHVTVGGDL